MTATVAKICALAVLAAERVVCVRDLFSLGIGVFERDDIYRGTSPRPETTAFRCDTAPCEGEVQQSFEGAAEILLRRRLGNHKPKVRRATDGSYFPRPATNIPAVAG